VKKDQASFITFTVVGAILFRRPLIVIGENNFDISQVIGWSLSGNDHLTIFPDIKGFSNEVLVKLFNSYSRPENIKSVQLSNIENSSADLYLPSFLNYWQVSIDSSYPELFIVSINDLAELSEGFINKFKFSPIINTDELGKKGQLRKSRLNHSINFGYISKEMLLDYEITSKNPVLFDDFKEEIEEVLNLKPRRIKEEFKFWFELLDSFNCAQQNTMIWILDSLLKGYISDKNFESIYEELIMKSEATSKV